MAQNSLPRAQVIRNPSKARTKKHGSEAHWARNREADNAVLLQLSTYQPAIDKTVVSVER